MGKPPGAMLSVRSGWGLSVPTTLDPQPERTLRGERTMRVQAGVLVPLGYGKYVRSDRVTAVVPIEEERGAGRRTFIYVQDQNDPLVASRAEDSVVRDLLQEPREVTWVRQQQEVLRHLLEALDHVT